MAKGMNPITAHVMNMGFGDCVPQVIEDYEVINLDLVHSHASALVALKRYGNTVLVDAQAWRRAVEQSERDLLQSLVPVDESDVFVKDDVLFEKSGRKVLITRTTKNCFYFVPADCPDCTPVKVFKSSLYKKVVGA